MKMHKSLIDRVMRTYDMWGGRSDDSRLRQALANLDLSVYTQKNEAQVVVLTEELTTEAAIAAQKNREYIR